MPDAPGADGAGRVAGACLAAAEASGRGAPYRATAVVDGVRCVVLGVDAPWGAQVVVMDEPRAAAVAAARAWVLERSPGCVVMTRRRYVSHPALAGFADVHEMPALVLCAEAPRPSDVAGVRVGVAADPEEFLAVYGAEHARLVTAADLADPAQTHLVARSGATPVAVALVRVAGAAACVSGVTVAPSWRRRGVGTAVSSAATACAVRSGAGLVWLHATERSRPVYERLGYRLADVHVQLS